MNRRASSTARSASAARTSPRCPKRSLRDIRGAEIAMVFQDPMTSLNPVLRISRQLIETMTAHGRFTPRRGTRRARCAAGADGHCPAGTDARCWPHQFSGGMRQRVMLAMGFANEPSLIIADEPTTALDVTIQAQILDLLRALNADLGTAVILISHDLGVIANVCSRVLVMYAGEVVEEGSPEDLLSRSAPSLHLGAAACRAAAGSAHAGDRRLATIEGQPPDARAWPEGCRFRARCPFAIDACAAHPAAAAGRRRPHGALLGDAGWAARLRSRRASVAAISRDARAPAGADSRCCDVRGLIKHFELPRDEFPGASGACCARSMASIWRCFPAKRSAWSASPAAANQHWRALVMRLDEPTAGTRRVRRTGHLARDAVGHPAVAAAHADDLPGPVCVAQPAHDGRRDPGRPAAAAPAWRATPRRHAHAVGGVAGPCRSARRRPPRDSRTNSPAASGSASRSPARWR